MLIGLYDKYFRTKFFNRIFFILLLVIVILLYILTVIITSNISRLLIDKELKYNEIVLTNLSNYFNDKYKLIRNFMINTYYEKYYMDKFSVSDNNINMVFQFMQKDMRTSSYEYINMKPAFDVYFSSAFSYDSDIIGISIYKLADRHVYQYSKYLSRNVLFDNFKYVEKIEQINDIYDYEIQTYPAYTPEYTYSLKKNAYTLAKSIHDLGSINNIGILLIDFDTDGITQLISRLNADFSGEAVILLDDGSVIYDSTGTHYGQTHPYAAILKNASGKVEIDNKTYLVNKSLLSDKNITIAILTPEDIIFAKVSRIRQVIIWVSAACILFFIIIMVTSSKIISLQVSVLVKAIKKMREGDFSARVPISFIKDEIGEISASFNKMSEDMSNYIEKVYVLEIKQKSAELAALQAQINPHFLYNTLETIRMKAVKNGDTEVENMIYTLAKLFRSSIKGKSIVRIEDEIKYCEFFLNLFKTRYELIFSYSFDIDDEILEYGIPKHLLQPVIENYIIHGFNPESANNYISIGVSMQDREIHFLIEDNGKGIKPERLAEIKKDLINENITHSDSIGLVNVNERIKIVFGSSFGIDIDSEFGKGSKVNIRIPARGEKELNLYVQGSVGR